MRNATASILLLLFFTGFALAVPCTIPDNGSGTIDMPPSSAYCPDGYRGHMTATVGLPVGTTMEFDVQWLDFYNDVEGPGGNLGGNKQDFDSYISVQISGTGTLTGWNRNLLIPVPGCETHTAPRTPYTTPQIFAGKIYSFQAVVSGDPDFDYLEIRAGVVFNLPSPGQTTITDAGSGLWNVDSFFDVTYEIEFVGALTSVLNEMSGTTQGTDRWVLGETPVPNESMSWGTVKSLYSD